ncbi:KTSC domain-containing protein [Chitinophagaceae bacterium 26-R-25]|nr:KTSC domain-containing protein [Chitinophagaceae bacterium 26-R-25]
MKTIKPLLLIFFCITVHSCSAQDCSNNPGKFNSYEQAKRMVTSSHFVFTDSINTGKSSFIKAAHFYSCDHHRGFFIIEMGKQKYIHQDMPIDIWRDFKAAESFGKYYNQNIKGNYLLHL